uniref:KH domain-containing protein n=1 Tax=Globodera pallida TaxID=36090 RepID=A0A183BPP1_GLOPA
MSGKGRFVRDSYTNDSSVSRTIMSKYEGGGFSSHDSFGYGQMPSGYPSIGGSAAPGAPPYGFSGAPFGSQTFGGEIPSPLDAEIQIVLREIQSEMHQLETSGEYGEQLKNARRLLATEATKLENNIDPEWLEVDINKPIKVSKKVLIPSFRHPKFNFVGKVLGPKGTTLQNIAKSYKCHVYILGRGSTRDRTKEQEMLNSGDPQYAHYGGPLHVKVETTAPPAVAYQRVAGVLAVLAELLQPVKDTHIEGITTEPNPNLNAQEGGGDSDGGGDANGADGDEAGGPICMDVAVVALLCVVDVEEVAVSVVAVGWSIVAVSAAGVDAERPAVVAGAEAEEADREASNPTDCISLF